MNVARPAMFRLVAALVGFLMVPVLRAQFGVEPARPLESLQIVRTVEPRFPLELKTRGITDGQVWLTILVDGDGQLVDRILIAYSHAAFAREAVEALHQWRFIPARQRGRPISVRTDVHFVFKQTGQLVSVAGPEMLLHQIESKRVVRDLTTLVANVRDLDEPIRAEKQVEARWPAQAGSRRTEARVTLDFFVDEYGRPRLITVTKSDGEPFSRAAMLALMRWRYAAPTRGGQGVTVRLVQEFLFQPPK